MPSNPKEQDYVHTRQYSTVESNSYLKKKTARLSSAVLSKLFACGQRQSLPFKGWKIGNRESRVGTKNLLLTDCLENKQFAVGSQKQVFSSFDGECNYLWHYSLRKTLVSFLLFSTAFSIQSVSAQNSNRNIANSGKKQIGQSPFYFPENSYYAVVTKIFHTQKYIDSPFSRVAVTAGIGGSQFLNFDRINEAVINDEEPSGLGIFCSLVIRVLQLISVIIEWSGQDLGIGLSIVPLKNIPVVITPAIRDISDAGNGARFIMGTGI